MDVSLSDLDVLHFRRAIELALEAEAKGNLPIGCVISLDGRIVGEGMNHIWVPDFNPTRHAEMEALNSVPRELWPRSAQMSLYTTLEPCLMCAGSIFQHSVGRVLFGTADPYGGSGFVFGHMSPYFERKLSAMRWLGPALPKGCDPLYGRVMELVERRQISL